MEDNEVSFKEVQRAALNLLTRREHGVAELQAKLADKGFEASVIDRVVSELSAKGLVSDDRFIEALIRSRLHKGQGPARIKQDLSQKRIEPEKVQEALNGLEDQWVQALEQARRKKFGDALPTQYADWVKQANFLQRRGFSSEQIRKALKNDPYD